MLRDRVLGVVGRWGGVFEILLEDMIMRNA